MKKMKKILAMLLALVMVMGMTMTASAETKKATITIGGNAHTSNTVYNYTQLVKEDRDSVLGWEFVNDQIANAFIEAFEVETAEDAIGALIAADMLENTENAAVKAGDINSSAALGEALEAVKTLATEKINDASVELDAIGLYIITASHDEYAYIPMAVYVNTEYEDVAVVAKGAKKEITKVLDNEEDESVSEGDVVEYTATTIYPFYSADAENKTFTATDKVTNATYVRDSIEIYLDKDADGEIEETDKKLVEGTDYNQVEFTAATESDNFTEKFDIVFKYNAEYASETVVVKYNVTVAAGAEDVTNTITTNFDPDGSSVTVDKVQVIVTKTDDGENPIPLAGATFAIYEAVENATEGYTETDAKVVIGNAAPVKETLYLKDVTSTALNGAGATAVSDAEGKVTFTGLDAQKTYYIKETNAPVGYSLNDNYYKLTNAGETGDFEDQIYTYADFAGVTVEDTKLIALPSTGGIGTTIFTAAGCGIMIAAAFFFFASRKKENE